MTDSLEPFVPRLAVDWLRTTPDATWREVEGSLAFVDISGFTALTERLARKGRVGAEEMSDILNATFADLLAVAYADGAGLVKWGGDALLLLFEGEGHAGRAVRASLRMRDRLARIGRIGSGSARVTLRMSVGVHSGLFHFFLVGDPEVHRELIVSGPGATRTARMESAAEADEVVVSPECAALLPPEVLGEPRGEGLVVAGEPGVVGDHAVPRPSAEGLDIAGLIPPRLRDHLTAEQGANEHRRITVAFVRFQGTDALLADEGPEALAAALDSCVRAAQEATERTGTTFFETDIDTDGGKIMLTAGAPVSRGGDEGRMLRAARRIVDAPGRLAVRVGVNRGPVFAGDFGPPFRRTFSVKGDAVNLAARLLGRAGPGQVVATREVLDHADAAFELEPLEPFTVKGKSEPVEAAVVGPIIGSAATGHSTDLVGREAEVAALAGALSSARAGEGRVVVVSGDAGIGKSRLLQRAADAWDGPRVVLRCDAYEAATPYWPFRALLREMVGAAPDAPAAEVASGLERLAADTAPELRAWLPLVAAVADVPMTPTPEVDAVAEEFRKARTEAVTAQFLAAALPKPVLITVDDAHLADAASADLLAALAGGIEQRPWALLAARRDTEGGFRPGPASAEIRPGPLDDVAAAALLRHTLGGTGLPPSDEAALLARAGGNPLFLRGLATAVRDGAGVDLLPDTVEALVTAQLDDLPAGDRTLLRVASVLGRSFDVEQVGRLLDEVPRSAGVARLESMGRFVRPEGAGRFRFQQQLIRDTAYEGLPHRLRRDLHGRAGELIEGSAPDPAEVSELLSLHYLQAGRLPAAAHYSRLAGHRAAAKHAYAEAEVLMGRALAAGRGRRGDESAQRARDLVALAEARRRVGRGERAIEDFRAARRLMSGDVLGQADLLAKEASVQSRLGRYTAALRTAGRGLAALEGEQGRAASRVRSGLAMLCSGARASQGRYADALEWARRAEAEARAARDPGSRANAAAMIFLALTLLGRPDRSYAETAIRLFERSGNRLAHSEALNNLALLSWMEGRGEESLEEFRAARDLAEQAGDAHQAAATLANIGDVLARLGRSEEAERALLEALAALQALGALAYVAVARRSLAIALADQGRFEQARREVAEARAIQERIGEDFELPETEEVEAMIAERDPG